MLHKSASIPVIPNRDELIINQQKLAALIPLLKNRSYKGNYQVKQDLISILSRFPHFNPIREESSFKSLIEETINSIEYTFVPKGSFVFHHADVGEKIYFLLDGMVYLSIFHSTFDFLFIFNIILTIFSVKYVGWRTCASPSERYLQASKILRTTCILVQRNRQPRPLNTWTRSCKAQLPPCSLQNHPIPRLA